MFTNFSNSDIQDAEVEYKAGATEERPTLEKAVE